MFIPTKSPWFKFFPRDFLYETKDMSSNEIGIYLQLSSQYWIDDCKPLTYEEMKKCLKGRCRPNQLDKFITKYSHLFENGCFKYINLDFSFAEAKQRSVNSRKANEAKRLKKLDKDFQAETYPDSESDTDTDPESKLYTDQESKPETDTDSKSESSSTGIDRLNNLINKKLKDK